MKPAVRRRVTLDWRPNIDYDRWSFGRSGRNPTILDSDRAVRVPPLEAKLRRRRSLRSRSMGNYPRPPRLAARYFHSKDLVTIEAFPGRDARFSRYQSDRANNL